MIDAVLSYHTNPATCGVAKFNQQLAVKLGVPFVWLHGGGPFVRGRALVSIKYGEIARHDQIAWPIAFDLFLHDVPPRYAVELMDAERVYAANPAIAQAVRKYRPDVIDAFCPSTIQGNPHRADLNVLTFGMAHKLQTPYYEKLKTLLDQTGEDYTVSVSTAVHEGSPWSAVSDAGEAIRSIFGSKTRVLGYLADDALAKELQDCAAVAMFFNPALRSNNTTAFAALDAGAMVITNTDAQSPAVAVLNIDTLAEMPSGAWLTVPHAYTWDRLLGIVQR